MPSIEELLHVQDKELAVFKSKAMTILEDHTEEITTLRKDVKKLTAFVSAKFEGMWIKIISLVSALIGIALFIAHFLG